MAGEPDGKDIRITIDFLRNFRQRVVTPMINEFDTNPDVLTLEEIGKLQSGTRALKAGVEKWAPAKLLMDSYDGPAGTGRTLNNEIQAMKTSLKELDRQLDEAIRIAESGENEALRLTTELTAQDIGQLFGSGTPAPSPTPGTGNGG